MQCKQGFSLLELMIAVAIMSILSLIALPTYQSYTQRARFTELMTAAEPFKLAITLALQAGIPLKSLQIATHGIPASPIATKNLASLTVKNGVITATGTDLIDHITYILKPDENSNTWTAQGSCLKKGWCDV